MLLAEDHLRRGDAVKAWAILSPLLRSDKTPSSRLCVLAAQSEERLNNPKDAHLWLQRAATAPREADWSDLDPSGESFDYTPQDWRRLVFSYGDTGELIHPRFDSRAPLRLPGVATGTVAAEVPSSSEKEMVLDQPVPTEAVAPAAVEPTAVEPAATNKAVTKGKNLAERLDSLLDRPKS